MNILQTINIKEVKGLPRLTTLDLSDQKIEGQISDWVWPDRSNLSHNLFESLEEPYHIYTDHSGIYTIILIDLQTVDRQVL